MSDIHPLPLVGHDAPYGPQVRARVFKAGKGWSWTYVRNEIESPLRHGPFESWDEAYASAHRMVELL